MKEISFLRGVPSEEALEAVTGIVEKGYGWALREYGAKLLQYQTPGVSDFNGFIPLKKHWPIVTASSATRTNA